MPSPTQFLGNTVGEAAAFAAGLAISPVLHPIVQALTNEAWSLDPTKPLDPNTVAEAVAHGHISEADGRAEAGLSGVSAARFAELVKANRTGPGVTAAFELWRRDRINDGQFDGALTRAGIEPEWIALLHDLKVNRLEPPVIALAIVRGIMDDPGFLPVGPPTTEGKIKAFPTSPIDSLKEAKAQGFDRERLFVQTAISGRPMGPESAAAASFRGIIDRVDYDRAISEGDIRNEWADAIYETSRQIPSPASYVAAHLKGWITETQMNEGVQRHGMSPADAHLLYLAAGRPAAPGQMATAAARGIDGPDLRPMDRAQFLKGIKESDIRPEWGPMLWDSRFLYPSLFQLSRLVQSGTIDADTAADWATKDRYAPEVVKALRTAWGQSSTGTAKGLTLTDLTADYEGLLLTRDEYVAALREMGYTAAAATGKARVSDAKRRRQARNQLIARARTRFTGWRIDEPAARKALTAARIDAVLQDELLASWQVERDINAADLTPAQIKKAYRRALMTRDEAVAELEARGYDENETRLLLDE